MCIGDAAAVRERCGSDHCEIFLISSGMKSMTVDLARWTFRRRFRRCGFAAVGPTTGLRRPTARAANSHASARRGARRSNGANRNAARHSHRSTLTRHQRGGESIRDDPVILDRPAHHASSLQRDPAARRPFSGPIPCGPAPRPRDRFRSSAFAPLRRARRRRRPARRRRAAARAGLAVSRQAAWPVFFVLSH